jgi:hypothetical protein
MRIHQPVTDIAANRACQEEISRWLNDGVDPSLVVSPHGAFIIEQVQAKRRDLRAEQFQHPVGAFVAHHATELASGSFGGEGI